MANVPLSFINEELPKHLEKVYRQRELALPVARRVGESVQTVISNWTAIQEHKWLLSERLGRDIGTEVAALDYFDNVRKQPASKGWQRLRLAFERLLENLDGDGPRSLANLERWMGQPSR